MKNLVIIFAFSLLSFQGFCNNTFEKAKDIKDCTINVKGVTADGKEYDLEITISDVSWIKCQAIKLLT